MNQLLIKAKSSNQLTNSPNPPAKATIKILASSTFNNLPPKVEPINPKGMAKP